jgi:hypothetical protein
MEVVLMDIPEEINTELERISKKAEIPIGELKIEHENIYNDWVGDFNELGDEIDRHKYIIRILDSRYVHRPKVTPVDIMPIGFEAINKSKKGNLFTSIYALHDKVFKRISMSAENCKLLDDISPFNMYENVKLGVRKDSNDMVADNRALFINPIAPDKISPSDIIKALKLKRITISQAKNNIATKDENGYTIKSKENFRVIKGFIERSSSSGTTENLEDEYGTYTITDDSTDLVYGDIDPSTGEEVRGFRIKMNPRLMKYGENATCDFVVFIEQGKKGLWITGIAVIGIIVPPSQEM